MLGPLSETPGVTFSVGREEWVRRAGAEVRELRQLQQECVAIQEDLIRWRATRDQYRIEIDKAIAANRQAAAAEVAREQIALRSIASEKRQQLRRRAAGRSVMYFTAPASDIPDDYKALFFRATYTHGSMELRLTGPYVDEELVTPYWPSL